PPPRPASGRRGRRPGALTQEVRRTVMEREADFLTALESAPEDDTAWLAYADWLEERGDPRGEHVRLTVALGRGEVEPASVSAATGQLRTLRGATDPAWVERCVRLRAARPMRLRIPDVQQTGDPGSAESQTALRGVLESGTLRVWDGVALPLVDGGTRLELVLPSRWVTDTAGYRPQLSAGEEPLEFTLSWPGHR